MISWQWTTSCRRCASRRAVRGAGQNHNSPRFSSRCPLGLSRICVLACLRKLLIKFAIANCWPRASVSAAPANPSSSSRKVPRRHHLPRIKQFCLSHLVSNRPSCRCDVPGPAKLGAVNPDAMHYHGQPACQRHDRLFHPAAPGDLHRPGLEPGPFLRDPHHLISAA